MDLELLKHYKGGRITIWSAAGNGIEIGSTSGAASKSLLVVGVEVGRSWEDVVAAAGKRFEYS